MRLSTSEYVRQCNSTNATISQNFRHSFLIDTKPTKKTICMRIEALPKLEKYSRLLKNYVEPNSSSTPVKLSKRWMDYQGIKNWEGLLDPLDNNLRSEIIRYGKFVEAAYRACDINPSSSSYATCRYHKRNLLNESGFKETGYQVTENLTVNSGIQLPRWIERAPAWVAMQSSWIGFVAVCRDQNEISRLGRRDVVIAFRGTITCLEWLENFRATLTPLPHYNSNSESDLEPMVASGFLSLYTSIFKTRQSLQNLVRHEISRILEKYKNEPLSFTITGHSLGAALATLAAYDIKKTFKNSPLVTVISFAGPRVGNWSFRCELEKQGTKILRIVNSDDLITKVPGLVVDDKAQTQCPDKLLQRNTTAGLGGWIEKLAEDSQLVYANVGCELRLSSRDSPYVEGNDIGTCHDLKTYLHLVDGFVGSNCPFRATARKMMNKTFGKNYPS
ncbi:phospholipase A(1) DAD1, chloroplastic-like [Primulina tabacum]|uniref:phospholipase A(1) DAD1, chloroplastic-like n=1 Tax=Primulina tabacum TaxID=48773 RepID=UPI003F597C82